MEVENPSNLDDENDLISTLKSNLNSGPCSTGSTTSSRNDEVLSIKESLKIKRMKELKFKKKCIELGLEQNDGLPAVPTSLEYVQNASPDISDVESVDGNISKLSSSTSGSCSSSSTSNNSEDEGSSLESDRNDSVALKRSDSDLPHLKLDLKPEKSFLDHKLGKQNKKYLAQITPQNEEDSFPEKEGPHFHENNIIKGYYNTYLNSSTQNSSLLKKNNSLKRKLDDDRALDPEEVNADHSKKFSPRSSNGKTPKLELEKKIAKNLFSEKGTCQDAPTPSVTLRKAHLANDFKGPGPKNTFSSEVVGYQDIDQSTHSEVNLLHLDLNKPKYRKSKLKPKLKTKNNAIHSDNLIDQVAEAFAKQLSALNLGQLTPFQASQLNMVLEKQNESLKQVNLSSSFNKFTSGFDQLLEPPNPPLVSSPMSSPSSETPNRLFVDADDILPIVAEVVMSDGSENGLDLDDEEIPDEESQVNDEVEKYVQSFIDCSNRGSVVEYPPLNNEVPTDGTDLTAWQLEKVSLPPFTPFVSPPSWLRFTIPAEGYKCTSCGDTFFIESSLVQHKERRSVWISLECGPCDAKLTFYNKCSFKEHIQYHSAKGEHVDEDTVAVRTLPLQLTKLLQPIMVPVPQSLRPMRALNKSSPMKHVKKILNSPGSLGKENQPKKELSDERSKTADDGTGVDHGSLGSPAKRNVRCYLCERMFFSVRELMSHMRTNQSSSDQRVECRKCLLVLPSVCAAKAHILTHPPANSSNISVCPECGSRCDGPRDFVHHLNTCGHQYRRSGVLCTQCQVCFFKFGEDFINHWIKEHCSKSYECVVCSNTFESLVFHKCSSPGQRVLATFKCLLTCPLCPYVVQLHTQEEKETQDKIRGHLADSHASVINRIHYVYKSKFCTNAFRSKDELRAHHDREHRRDNHYRTKTCTLHHEVLGYQHQYFNGQEPRNAFITMSVALSPEEMEEAQTRDVPTVSSVIDKTLFPDAPMTLETIKGLKAEKEKASKQALEAKEDHTKEPPAKKDSEFVESLRPHVCYRCGYTYTGSKDFRRHKRSCEGESAVRLCQVCGVSAVGEEFSKHCLTHVREGVVMCMYCNGAPFSTDQMLNQHFELHVHEQFSYPVLCAFCNFSMSDVGVALSHLHKEHDPNSVLSPSLDSLDVECERCGRKFHGERGLNVHLTRCTVGTATPMPTPAAGRQCHVCKKALTSEMFGKHIISHLEEGLLVCSLCDGLALPSSMALLHHLEEHASTLQYPSVCPMCSFNMTSTSYALAHLKEDHGFGNLSCDECEMHYTFTYQLQRHIDIVHRVCLYAKRRYICWICRAYDHVKKETLMNHFRMVHGLSMEEVDEKVMIRTRGQGTMPTSHFIPTKPLGSKELGGVSKGDSKSEGDSPKFKGKTSDSHSNKSKVFEEATCSRMTSHDVIKSSVDEAQMEINLENIVIKKELLDVIGKVSDGETYSSPDPPLNAEVSTTFKKSPSLSDIKIKSERDDTQTASEVLDSKPKTAYRRHKKIRRKLFTSKRDRKLRENTKVLIKRLPESTLVIRPAVSKKAEPESKPELATKQVSGLSNNTKKKKKKQFRCNLCSYSSNSDAKLKGHQAKHDEGSEADGFVCGECGQSFVVEPSLKRHLFFAHKIKQKPQPASKATDSVFEVRKTSRKRKPTPKLAATVASPPNPRRITIKIKKSHKVEKEIKTSDEKESELQCCVCKEEFESSVKLYSHLRTHGMAFLKMGRKKRGFIQQERASIKC